MKSKLILLGLLAILFTAKSQQTISFDEALESALANNFNIQLANVATEVAKNSASRENNDYLPTVTANGNYTWAKFAAENKLVAETRSFEPANSYNYGASITASYTLFDGFGRKYRYLQSAENAKFSEIQLKQIIQTTILELSTVYYEIARLEENLTSLQNAIEITKERLTRAKYNYEYGQVNKLEVLNAKVDLNTDSIALLTGTQELENLKRNLNFIMGRDIQTVFSVQNSVDIQQDFIESEVIAAAEKNNIDLVLSLSEMRISELAIGSTKSNWWPMVNASASYIYNGSENPNSPFVIGSTQYGPQAGLNLSWTIFNGTNKTAIQNAKLNLKSRELQQKALQMSVKSQALNTFNSYQTLLFILQTQAHNLATAQDNFSRSKNAFNRGQISTIEFRQAQLNLLNAEQALSKAKYDAKNAELRVLAAMGELVD